MDLIKKISVIKPEITSYQHHTAILSFLDQNDISDQWVFANYIQLFSIWEENRISFFDFYSTSYIINSCPWIKMQHFSREQLAEKDIATFIIDCINENKYVYLVTECKHISVHNYDHPFPHPLIIFGYDRSRDIFHIADFFNGIFSFQEASFYEIEASYAQYIEDSFWWSGAKVFERTTTSFPNSCSLSHLISIFSDYINSTNNADYKLNYGSDEHHFINDINYKSIGISVYNDIIKNIENNIENNIDNFDFRIIPILTDHKKNILSLITYLCKNEIISSYHLNNFNEVFDNIMKARNLFLKDIITKQYKNKLAIVEHIKKVKNLEYEAMSLLIQDLQKSST